MDYYDNPMYEPDVSDPEVSDDDGYPMDAIRRMGNLTEPLRDEDYNTILEAAKLSKRQQMGGGIKVPLNQYNMQKYGLKKFNYVSNFLNVLSPEDKTTLNAYIKNNGSPNSAISFLERMTAKFRDKILSSEFAKKIQEIVLEYFQNNAKIVKDAERVIGELDEKKPTYLGRLRTRFFGSGKRQSRKAKQMKKTKKMKGGTTLVVECAIFFGCLFCLYYYKGVITNDEMVMSIDMNGKKTIINPLTFFLRCICCLIDFLRDNGPLTIIGSLILFALYTPILILESIAFTPLALYTLIQNIRSTKKLNKLFVLPDYFSQQRRQVDDADARKRYRRPNSYRPNPNYVQRLNAFERTPVTEAEAENYYDPYNEEF